MKKAPLVYALIYSALVIAFKLAIILGGFALTNFGFNWSHVISVWLIIPFCWLTIRSVRQQNGGYIGGKRALQASLQMCFIAIAIVSAYNYIEFEWKWKDLAGLYYHGDAYLHFLEKNKSIKPGDYPKIIDSMVASFREMSPFKHITVKLIAYLFFGVSSSFIFAMFMKKNPPYSMN